MPSLRRLLICLLMPALCASLFAQVPNFAETKKRAEAGEAIEQVGLALRYRFGRGVPQDYAEAAKWFRRAADQGDANAQTHLGSMYNKGDGVPQDYSEAAKWFRKAADQGYASAQTQLGSLYCTGDGVPKDEVEAAKWYRRAADQGDFEAVYTIGSMYSYGSGVQQDDVEAYAWYNVATTLNGSAFGYEFIKQVRDRMKLKLTTEQVARGQKRSTELFNEIEARKKAAGE